MLYNFCAFKWSEDSDICLQSHLHWSLSRRTVTLQHSMRRGWMCISEGYWEVAFTTFLTPDFEWDHSLWWIYLKVGQQPPRRPQHSQWGGGPRFPSQFKCRLFWTVNHTHVFIIDFQMIGFYIAGLGPTVLHSWIYIMPKE